MAHEDLSKTYSGQDDLFATAPKRNVKALRKAFKAAQKRVEKAHDRYVDLIHSLWVENARGELVQATYHCLKFDGGKWKFREYITDSYDAFYRRGRGEKRYAEIWGHFELVQCKRVAFSEVKKLEDALQAAFERRETLLTELEKAGVDVFNDADIW